MSRQNHTLVNPAIGHQIRFLQTATQTVGRQNFSDRKSQAAQLPADRTGLELHREAVSTEAGDPGRKLDIPETAIR